MQKFGTIPGVYVSEIENPEARIAVPTLRTVGIIGRSMPSLTKYDVVVTRSADSDYDTVPGVLSQNIQSIACISNYANASGSNLPQYEQGIDYALDENGIHWLNLPEVPPTIVNHPTDTEVLNEEAADRWGAKRGDTLEPAPTSGALVYYVEDTSTWPLSVNDKFLTFSQVDALKDDITITSINDLWVGEPLVYYTEEVTVDETTTNVDHVRLLAEGESIEGKDIRYVVNDVDTTLPSCWVYSHTDILPNSKITIASAYSEVTDPGHRASDTPANGATYYVSLTYQKDASNVAPITFEDFDSVKAAFGPELYTVTENGELVTKVNEVVAGAKLAFANGADVVTCLEVLTDGEDAVKNAIDQMCSTDVISFVCIPATTTSLQQYLLNAVVIASSLENQKEKTSYICPVPTSKDVSKTYIEKLKLLTVDEIISQAEGFHEERLAMMASPYCTIVCEDLLGNVFNEEVSSIYAACAMVGWHGNNNNTVALPLTRKTLTGIYDVYNYKRSDVEKLTRGGVTVMVNKNESTMINQSVTTNTSSYNTAEISVVLIKDEIKRSLRDPLDSQFIGTVVKKTTGTSIKTAVTSILDSLIDQIILSYDSLKVTQNQIDTTQFEVSFRVSVCRPLNYINISFMVNL